MRESLPTMTRIPRYRSWLRLLAIGYGLALWFWLQLEDNTVVPVTLFGLGMTLLASLFWLLRQFGGQLIPRRYIVVGGGLVGALVGLGTAVATALLMLLKTGLHGHLYPDYPPGLIIALLERAPVWVLAGGLAGVGVALLWVIFGVTTDP